MLLSKFSLPALWSYITKTFFSFSLYSKSPTKNPVLEVISLHGPTGPHQQPLIKAPLTKSLAGNITCLIPLLGLPHHHSALESNVCGSALSSVACISAIIDSNIEPRYCRRVCMHNLLSFACFNKICRND
jgi:hypothetical protein